MRYFLLAVVSLLFLGCEVNQSTTSTPPPTPPIPSYVEVYTLGPVVNSIVTDSANQVAIYDEKVQKYYFKNGITYPVSVQASTQTYVDIDYDSNKTAADLNVSSLFVSNGLRSFCREVNYLTDFYYEQNLSANGITTDEYLQDIKTRFGADICLDVFATQENARTLFGAYNYVLTLGKINSLSDIESAVTEVDEFFDNYLTKIQDDVNRTKYYSAYNALTKLDEGKVSRVDTIHKPDISTLLRANLTLQNSNSSVDVFDILLNATHLYLAAGHDELAKSDKDLTNTTFSSNVGLLSFGSRLHQHDFGTKECLFLANSRVGLTSFELSALGFTKEANISKYSNDVNISNFSEKSVTNSNSYVSVNENKRLLGIATADKGYYLINIKDSFTGCKPVVSDINSTRDFIIQENNGSVVDATFRDDGTYLYVAHKGSGVYGYKTDILDKTETMNSKKIFGLKETQEAYNLKLFNNDNELFVTTDKGVLIYDVGSATDNLSFVSEYRSEGSQKDYYPYIDSFGEYIFFTDGYKGLKVLKLDNSFHPMLCGVGYFAPRNSSYELAKTTSVKYENGNLYVGITSYGVVKFRLDDILFEHCK